MNQGMTACISRQKRTIQAVQFHLSHLAFRAAGIEHNERFFLQLDIFGAII